MIEGKAENRRTPDCVTQTRMGNSVLVVSGFFKQDATMTAEDKMARVLEAENSIEYKDMYSA